jgi:hypothetical protein
MNRLIRLIRLIWLSTPTEVGFRRQSMWVMDGLPHGLPQRVVADLGNKNPRAPKRPGISD